MHTNLRGQSFGERVSVAAPANPVPSNPFAGGAYQSSIPKKSPQKLAIDVYDTVRLNGLGVMEKQRRSEAKVIHDIFDKMASPTQKQDLDGEAGLKQKTLRDISTNVQGWLRYICL
eukprot:SAG31_NODE_27199_length_430_cov_0.592145_1_plen_115_part_10